MTRSFRALPWSSLCTLLCCCDSSSQTRDAASDRGQHDRAVDQAAVRDISSSDAKPSREGTVSDSTPSKDKTASKDKTPSKDSKPPSDGTVSSITHGSQLTKAHVGPAAIGLNPAACTIAPGSVGTTKPSWVTRTVGAGGEVIDGFQVPAGVWVVEGCTITSSFQIYGNAGSGTAYKGMVVRGCEMRFAETVVPGIYVREQANAPIWLLHNDMGSPSPSQGNMTPIANIDGSPGAGSYIYRNFISRTSTGIQINADNGHVIENYVEDLLLYEPSLHLNGFTTNGGIKGIEILRNHIVVNSPDSAGHQITQTDAISFFQDFGDFQGTAPGGYQVKDNFIGGGGYALYAGMNSGKPATSVKNMIVTGNKFTTIGTWPNSGYWGPVAAEPVWGQYGNLWSSNTWADGPNAGKSL